MIQQGAIESFPQAKALGDGWQDMLWIADGSEGNKTNAVGKGVTSLSCYLQGQACFPHSPGADERHQSDGRLPQEGSHGCDLTLAPQKRGQWHRKRGAPWCSALPLGRGLQGFDRLVERGVRVSAQTSLCTGDSRRARRNLQVLRLHGENRFPDMHAKEPGRNRLQLMEGQGLRLAQVDPLQLPLPRAIGSPVRSPAPVACPFFVRGEAAVLTAKGKGGGSLKPAIPVGRIHHHLSGLAVQLVSEDAILDDWRSPNRDSRTV